MSVKATLRRTWPVLVSYAIFSMWGICCLTASIVLTSASFGSNPGNLATMAGIVAAVAVGHVLGNVIGLAGFRLAPVTVIFVAMFIAAPMTGIALGPLALFLIVAAFAAYGGYLGIGSRLDVVASWYPLTLCVGGAITWMNAHHAVSTFNSGSKHQLWDAFTIVCLAGGVFWMLVFMATRNSLGLTVWQEVARPRNVNVEHEDVAVARPGRGSFFVLMAFTLVILGVTALVSPYLFRTAEGDKDGQQQGEDDDQPDPNGKQKQGDGEFRGKQVKGHGHAGGGSGEQDGQGKGKAKGKGKGKGQGQGDDDKAGDGKPDTEGASQAAEEAAKLGIKILAYLLAVAAILLVLYLLVMPPIRRAFLMRHLERPLWPVAPTSRVMNHWRRALTVLAIEGIEPAAGETATDFAGRATKEIQETLACDAPGLGDAAKIVEKIAYAGRGLGTADEQAVKDATTRFIDVVRPHIKLRKRFTASWGRAPEVES